MAHFSLLVVTIVSAIAQSVEFGVRAFWFCSCDRGLVPGKCVFMRRSTTSSLDLVYVPFSYFSISGYSGSLAKALLSFAVVLMSLTSSQNLTHDVLLATLREFLYFLSSILYLSQSSLSPVCRALLNSRRASFRSFSISLVQYRVLRANVFFKGQATW